MVAALTISLLYARYLIPLVCAHWLRRSDAEAAERATGWLGRLTGFYHRAIGKVLAAPLRVGGITAVAVAGAGLLSWYVVPSGFMPKMDEGGFILDYKAQPGAALRDTDRNMVGDEA